MCWGLRIENSLSFYTGIGSLLVASAAKENAPGMTSISTGVFPISSPSASIHAGGADSTLTLVARVLLTCGLL
jgi:hypothetical protein